MSDIVERLKGLANEARVSAEGSMAFSLLNDSSTAMNAAAAEITVLQAEVERLRERVEYLIGNNEPGGNPKGQFYGQDCPKRMVQVEHVGCSPANRVSAYGWRPIDTAPKDGTQFLCYDPNRTDGCPMQCAKWIYAVDDGSGPDLEGGVWVADGRQVTKPTHWMPVPPPPPALSQGGGA